MGFKGLWNRAKDDHQDFDSRTARDAAEASEEADRRELGKSLHEDDFRPEKIASAFLRSGGGIAAAEVLNGPTPLLEPGQVGPKRRPGRPRGRSWDDKVSFSANRDLIQKLDDEAVGMHTSRAAVIRQLLSEALAARDLGTGRGASKQG